MRRTLFTTALENADVDMTVPADAKPVSAETIEETNGEIAAIAERADNESNDQAEMANVAESLGDVRAIVEASGEEGLSDEGQAAVDVAMEHLIAQLGISTQHLVAMESHEQPLTGAARKKATLEQLDYVDRILDRGYQVSEEAFSDHWREFVEKITLNEEKVALRLRTAAQRFNAPGREVTTGDWAKPLAIAGSSVDGAALKKEADKLFASDKQVVSLFEKLCGEVKLLTGEIRETWFFASKHRIEAIEAIGKRVEEAYASHDFGPSFRSVDLDAPSLKPLTAAEVNDIAKKLIAGLENSELKKAIADLSKQNTRHVIFQLINSSWRLKNGFVRFISAGVGGAVGGSTNGAADGAIGSHVGNDAVNIAQISNIAGSKFARNLLNAKDLAKAQDATDYTKKAVDTLRQLMLDRIRFSNAVASYIEKSSS